MKRILATLISALLLSVCTVTACAEGFSESMEWIYEVNTDGQTATITIGSMAVSQNSGKVEIPMKIDGYTVSGIGSENRYAEKAKIIYNYNPETYKPVGSEIAVILCAAAVLVPVVVAVVFIIRRKKVCPDCGKKIEDNSKFCGGCGRKL